MRHSIYVPYKKVTPAQCNIRVYNRGQPPDKFSKNKGSNQNLNKSLGELINESLKLYENDTDTKSEIFGKLSIYRLNITMARGYNDYETEKKLEKEFRKFLNTKIKNKEKR